MTTHWASPDIGHTPSDGWYSGGPNGAIDATTVVDAARGDDDDCALRLSPFAPTKTEAGSSSSSVAVAAFPSTR